MPCRILAGGHLLWVLAFSSAVMVTVNAQTTTTGFVNSTLPCWQCIKRRNINITAVVHGIKSSSFWKQVQRAALTAGYNLHINLKYELLNTFNSTAMSLQIAEEVAKKPHALLVTIPSSSVESAVRAAASQVPVFSFNSGYDKAISLGSKAHFAMHEYNGGLWAGPYYKRAFTAAGKTMRRCLVINHEAGNDGLAQRSAGFAKYCQDAGLSLQTIDVNGSSLDAMRLNLSSEFASLSSSGQLVDTAVLCLGQTSVLTVVSQIKNALNGTVGDNFIGTFDVGVDVLAALRDKDIIFGVDQNQWLQGYLPVLLATLYVTTGQLMPPSMYNTGPAFITEAPNATYLACSAEAFPVCQCPWAGHNEASVPTSMCWGKVGVDPVIPSTCGCTDIRQIKIGGVVHGTQNDAFWQQVRAGALQAAGDYRLVDFKLDLYSQFSKGQMAHDISKLKNDSSVAGIFVTLPGTRNDEVSNATSDVAKHKWVVSINSGSSFAKDLDPGTGKFFAHCSQDEYLAGQHAAQKLMQHGATHILCAIHNNGNSALDNRCQGAVDYSKSNGGNVTFLQMGLHINASSSDDIVKWYKQELTADPTIDAILTVVAATVPPVLIAMNQTRSVLLGCFDTSAAIHHGIQDGTILFSIDQLPYMQGYMAVVMLVVKILTGLSLALPSNKLLVTGPSLVTTVDPIQTKCFNQAWTPAVGSPIGYPVCRLTPPMNCSFGQLSIRELSCQNCSAGTFMPLSSHRELQCHACPIGFYSPLTGMSECWSCPSRSYNNKTGSTFCLPLLDCDPCINRAKVKIRAVVHGLTSDTFWLRVKRAMLTAAAFMQVDFDVQLQIRTNHVKMAQNIADVVSQVQPHVLLVTIPDPQVHQAIIAAAQKVYVFSFNSGIDIYRSLGSLAHFSMNEKLGGIQSVDHFQNLFIADGIQMVACIFLNHEQGNGALISRAAGFEQECTSRGMQWLGVGYVTGSDVPSHVQWGSQVVADFLASSNANGGLAILQGEATVFGVSQAYVAAGKPVNIKAGSFDCGNDAINGMKNGVVAFGINQNEWLQGFLPVVFATMFVTTSNYMLPTFYPTGPEFVTKAPSQSVIDRQSEAFPTCDCPWAVGLESQVQCVPNTTIGPCPVETICNVPCADPRNMKIVGVTHGHESDAFWFVAKAGAEQAALDLRLKGFEMNLFGPPGSGRPDAYTEELYEQAINATANRTDVDAMFVTITSPSVYNAIRAAAKRKIVITINAGFNVSESLNPRHGRLVAHVGMNDTFAGLTAARALINSGADHLLCIIADVHLDNLDARCAGACAGMHDAHKKCTAVNIKAQGVNVSDDSMVATAIQSILRTDPTINSLLCAQCILVPGAVMALNAFGKTRGRFSAGSFDVCPAVMSAIQNGQFFSFGIDQQQYAQGYATVIYLWTYFFTGTKLSIHALETGPVLLRASYHMRSTCQALKWQASVVGANFLPLMDPALTVGYPVCEKKPPKNCGPGYFLNGQNDCEECGRGRYKVGSNMLTQCTGCPAGTFAENTGTVLCKECRPGNYSNTTGCSLCSMCAVGKYTHQAGEQDCNACDPGFFQGDVGRSACRLCDIGSYAPVAISINCTTCRGGRTTQSRASTSRKHCLCKDGFFSQNPTASCQTCPNGMTCRLGSDLTNFFNRTALPTNPLIPLEYPRLKELHSASADHPTSVYRCLTKESCPGGDPGTCGPHMSGIACGKCDDGFYRAEDSTCQRCSILLKSKILYPTFPLVIGPLIVVAMYSTGHDRVNKWGSPPNMALTLLFLMLIHLQVLAVLDTLYLLRPPIMQAGTGSSSYFMDLFSVLRPSCSTFTSFKAKNIIKLFRPIVIGIIFLGVFLASKAIAMFSKLSAMNGDIMFNLTMGVFNTFFVSITQQAFCLFQCYPHYKNKRSLRSEPFILCYSAEWTEVVVYAVVSILVFCGGLIALVTHSIKVAPERFREERFRFQWKFLYLRFRPTVHWWSLTLLAKGIWLNLTTVIFDKGTTQLVWAMSGTLVYLSATIHWLPWRSPLCSYLDVFSNLVTMLCFAFLPTFEIPDIDRDGEPLAVLYVTIAGLPIYLGISFACRLFHQHCNPACEADYIEIAQDLIEHYHGIRNPTALAKVLFKLPVQDLQTLQAANEILAVEVHAERGYNRLTTADLIDPEMRRSLQARHDEQELLQILQDITSSCSNMDYQATTHMLSQSMRASGLALPLQSRGFSPAPTAGTPNHMSLSFGHVRSCAPSLSSLPSRFSSEDVEDPHNSMSGALPKNLSCFSLLQSSGSTTSHFASQDVSTSSASVSLQANGFPVESSRRQGIGQVGARRHSPRGGTRTSPTGIRPILKSRSQSVVLSPTPSAGDASEPSEASVEVALIPTQTSVEVALVSTLAAHSEAAYIWTENAAQNYDVRSVYGSLKAGDAVTVAQMEKLKANLPIFKASFIKEAKPNTEAIEWICTWRGGVLIRLQPDLAGIPRDDEETIKFLERFFVSETFEKKDELSGVTITFLRLADGRGWVFDRSLRRKVCELVEAVVGRASDIDHVDYGAPAATDAVEIAAAGERAQCLREHSPLMPGCQEPLPPLASVPSGFDNDEHHARFQCC